MKDINIPVAQVHEVYRDYLCTVQMQATFSTLKVLDPRCRVLRCPFISKSISQHELHP